MPTAYLAEFKQTLASVIIFKNGRIQPVCDVGCLFCWIRRHKWRNLPQGTLVRSLCQARCKLLKQLVEVFQTLTALLDRIGFGVALHSQKSLVAFFFQQSQQRRPVHTATPQLYFGSLANR